MRVLMAPWRSPMTFLDCSSRSAVFAAALMFVSVCGSAAPAPKDADPKLGKALDAWAKPLVDSGHLSGQLLVVRNGKVILERSYGYANRELKVPMTPETRMCIASI